MNFGKALDYLKQGEAVRVRDDPEIYSLSKDCKKLHVLDKRHPEKAYQTISFMNIQHILSNDWEVIE